MAAGSATGLGPGAAWALLLLGAACEIAWAVGLRFTGGFNIAARPWPTTLVIVTMLLSFVFLAQASRGIPAHVAYTVWVGLGVLGTWACSVWLLKDPARWEQIFAVGLILAGVGLLKLTS